MSATRQLIDFTNRIEGKELVSHETAIRIRRFIGTMEDATPIQLFMIVSAMMGALFCSAGFFSIISHNWDAYPNYIRGIFSVVPALVALYFYYRALFHHPNSKTWIEASSVFLMLMIGASIALVSQTYQLDGDFTTFIKVWALLTIPLFYFAKASGISLLYLGLIVVLVVDISLGLMGIPSIKEGENLMWYWVLLLGFLPHYYLALNKQSRSQSIRVVYMSYALYFSFMIALLFTIDGNFILWISTVNVGFYLFGKRYMGGNQHTLARPFQWLSQFSVVAVLILISNSAGVRFFFGMDSFVNLFKPHEINAFLRYSGSNHDDHSMFYFTLVLVVLSAIYFVYFYFRKHFKECSMLFVLTPAFLFFAMFSHEFILPNWTVVMLVNAYILFLGFSAMMVGSENENTAQLVAGFILISYLLWIRYFDTEWNFILKGLTFIAIGGLFFLINVLMRGKLERISRNKTRSDEY